MTTEITCALLQGPSQITWELTDRTWLAVAGGDVVREDLMDCFPDLPALIHWSADGQMYLYSRGWSHYFAPGLHEGQWFGTTAPIGPTDACLQALDGAGLSLPVTLSMTVTTD